VHLGEAIQYEYNKELGRWLPKGQKVNPEDLALLHHLQTLSWDSASAIRTSTPRRRLTPQTTTTTTTALDQAFQFRLQLLLWPVNQELLPLAVDQWVHPESISSQQAPEEVWFRC